MNSGESNKCLAAPGVFRQVAVGNPSDPKTALRKTQAAVAELMQDEEFKDLRETPGVFQQVAVTSKMETPHIQVSSDESNYVRSGCARGGS